MSTTKEFFDEDLPDMVSIIFGSLNKYMDNESRNRYDKTDDTLYILREYETIVSNDMSTVIDEVECKFTISYHNSVLMKTRVLLEGVHVEECVTSYDNINMGNITHMYETIMTIRLNNIRKLYPYFQW
jgi:hypothetical protein